MQLAIDRPLARRLGSLAVPVVIAMVSQTLINWVDHILIGRLPSAESIPGQAALGPALNLFWAVGGTLAAISVGTQALTARRLGEQQHSRAGQVLFNSIIVAAGFSAFASFLGWVAAPSLFRMIHHVPEEVRLGIPYLKWRMAGVFAMVVTMSYKSWFDGLGRTRVFMGVAITMNIINAVLNVLLIFGVGGFPRLGMEGSGIASMISSYIGLAMLIGWSLRYRKSYDCYHLKNVSRRQQWELIKLSAPSALATLFVMSGFSVFYKIVGILDGRTGEGSTVYAAATQNIIVILMAFFTGCMAYGTATATLVGQSMGAKQYDLAERYGWEAVKIGVYLTLVVGLGVIVFPDAVLHVFSKDAAVIAVARPILRICGALLPFVLSALVLTQALFGAGNTKFVMKVEFGLHFFCLVPLAYLFGIYFGWGVLGVWMGAFAYIILLCTIMGWKFAEGAWKEIQI
ncbi:MAG: MATE family efflux transporter [Polyangia bacterium]